jgi:PPK2 family polyphosphate:nucleotide phosphotransferase
MKTLTKAPGKGKKFNILKQPTRYTGKSLNKEKAQLILDEKSKKLAEMQEVFYADGKWALLVILQGMDGSGKDSCVKRIFSGINPQGCQVYSFKAPTSEELKHDFLWRCMKQLPEQGKIGIFNRSYYEEVLVVRAYKDLLDAQQLPDELMGKNIWKHRFEDINNFEKYLSRNGIRVVKFYLNISKEEQAERLLKRALNKDKYWKVGEHDLQINKDYNKFTDEINDMLMNTSTPHAPWHIVPADDKWYAQVLMMDVILEELKSLKSKFPKPTPEQKVAIEEAKKVLGNQKA